MTNDQIESMIQNHDQRIAEIWALFRKTDEQIDRLSRESRESREQQKKTDEQIAQVSKQMAKTDEKIDKLTDKWGRFIEAFLAPGIPRAFQERGIPIIGTSERQKRIVGGSQMEIDILGVNTDCVLAVEVKSTLRPEYVRDFLERLPTFKRFFPEYKDRLVYGAVAGIEIVQAADVFAYKQGLWVITQAGDTVVIKNDEQFQPKTW